MYVVRIYSCSVRFYFGDTHMFKPIQMLAVAPVPSPFSTLPPGISGTALAKSVTMFSSLGPFGAERPFISNRRRSCTYRCSGATPNRVPNHCIGGFFAFLRGCGVTRTAGQTRVLPNQLMGSRNLARTMRRRAGLRRFSRLRRMCSAACFARAVPNEPCRKRFSPGCPPESTSRAQKRR